MKSSTDIRTYSIVSDHSAESLPLRQKVIEALKKLNEPIVEDTRYARIVEPEEYVDLIMMYDNADDVWWANPEWANNVGGIHVTPQEFLTILNGPDLPNLY